MDGLLVVDKPSGPTSHDVVAAIRRAAGQRRVGHAGTLDPAARGVLVVLLGRLTRLADLFTGQPKEYLARVRLGVRTSTGDAEGEEVARAPVPELSENEVEAAVAGLVGMRRQTPPAFSARKVDGRPLYARARAGEPIPEVQAKEVTVHAASLVAFEPPEVVLRMKVSKGTYVRVLAEELGEALELPAHLADLIRTSSGPFTLRDARPLDELAAGGPDGVASALVDLAAHEAGVRRGRIPRPVASRALHGHWVAVKQVRWLGEDGRDALLFDEQGLVGWYRQDGLVLRPKAVLRTAQGPGYGAGA